MVRATAWQIIRNTAGLIALLAFICVYLFMGLVTGRIRSK